MGGHWRFRRSFGLGSLFRVNVGKKGVSVTAGRRRGGPHLTVHSSGRTTTSAGIPGSGLSYVVTTPPRRSRIARATTVFGRVIATAVILLVVASILMSVM